MRKASKGILTAGVLITVLFSANSVFSQHGDLRAAIEAANNRFEEALGRGDATALADLYTPNAMVFPANTDIVKGKEAIKNLFQGLISSGVKGITLTTVEVDRCGDTANEVGKYILKDGNGKELDNGKYIVVWKRMRGQWKLHRDIFNTNMPTPAG